MHETVGTLVPLSIIIQSCGGNVDLNTIRKLSRFIGVCSIFGPFQISWGLVADGGSVAPTLAGLSLGSRRALADQTPERGLRPTPGMTPFLWPQLLWFGCLFLVLFDSLINDG